MNKYQDSNLTFTSGFLKLAIGLPCRRYYPDDESPGQPGSLCLHGRHGDRIFGSVLDQREKTETVLRVRRFLGCSRWVYSSFTHFVSYTQRALINQHLAEEKSSFQLQMRFSSVHAQSTKFRLYLRVGLIVIVCKNFLLLKVCFSSSQQFKN